uniref:NAD(P)-binding protein n=1 Tax=Mycena chlorophos TaxID=658473 RepID=A0ABQ0LTE9_MYCCL|nr:NAD(P)-binding protein [Mycena chlorophos]
MPPFPQVVALNEAAFKYQLALELQVPVAVVFGGTSGIGHAVVEALCEHLGGRVHVVLAGRDGGSTREVLAAFPTSGEGMLREFVQCDVGSLASVKRACDEVNQLLEARSVARVDYLVLNAGYNSWSKHAVTNEGLDLHLELRYYYRALVAQELVPLLEAASTPERPARVLSVLGAGFVTKIDLDNLGNTVKPRNGAFRPCLRGMMMSHAYTDAWFAHLASTYPTISFIHAHPGAVVTKALTLDLPFPWGAPLNALMNLLVRYAPRAIGAVPPRECGEHMLFGVNDAKAGLELRDRYGEVISARGFEAGERIGNGTEPGKLNGTMMKGYSPSDASVHVIVRYTEDIFKRVLGLRWAK